MFLETQPQGQPVKEKKPSELLREGIPHVIDNRAVYLLQGAGGCWYGCANGTIAFAAGVRGDSEAAANWCYKNLGVELMNNINLRHSTSWIGESREEIVTWLESIGK